MSHPDLCPYCRAPISPEQRQRIDTRLTTPLPGMDIRPLDLLRAGRWRAFCGAMRARSALTSAIAPDELIRRRRAEVSWAVPEPPMTTDSEEAA